MFSASILREDTLQKKVYILSNYTDEGLLYDFGMLAGDSAVIINTGCMNDTLIYHLQSVDSVQMSDGSFRKRFHLDFDTWIEGLGSLAGPLRPGCLTVGTSENLVCYYQDNQFMYLNPPYASCFYSHPSQYFNYIDTNNLWNYTETYGIGVPNYTTLFRFKKDTLIGGQTYYIAEATADSVHWHALTDFYREDNKRVYILHNGTESLVFDANANLGDTLQIFHDDMGNPALCPDTCLIKIMGIDLVNTGGLYRKRLHFQYLNCPGSIDYWITGIGFRYGIVKKCFEYIGPPALELVCYYENDSLMFKNPAYTTCFSVWVNADVPPSSKDEVSLIMTGKGFYTFESDVIIKQIDIFSMTAVKVFQVSPCNNKTDLNLTNLPHGIYMAVVYVENEKKYVFKIFI